MHNRKFVITIFHILIPFLSAHTHTHRKNRYLYYRIAKGNETDISSNTKIETMHSQIYKLKMKNSNLMWGNIERSSV